MKISTSNLTVLQLIRLVFVSTNFPSPLLKLDPKSREWKFRGEGGTDNKNQLKSHEILKRRSLDSYRYPRSFTLGEKKLEDGGRRRFPLSSSKRSKLMRQWIRICPGRWCLEVKRKNKKDRERERESEKSERGERAGCRGKFTCKRGVYC